MYAWIQPMRRCAAHSGSRNISSTCHYATKHGLKSMDADSSGSIAEPGNTPADGVREDAGFQNVATTSFPVSPLMDPKFKTAREKWTQPKARPSAETLTPFQQQLANNVYAQALATPIRACVATGIRLPNFFLQDFEMIQHPETKEPWYLPRSLTSPYTETAEPSTSIEPDGEEVGGNITKVSENGSWGGKSYLLRRQDLLAASNQKPPWPKGYGRVYEKLLHPKFKQSNAIQVDNIRWRTDIDAFIVKLMQKRIIESVTYLAKKKKGYVVPCADMEDVRHKKQIGAILWLGGEEAAPAEFATLDLDRDGKKIPVYNLPKLLGAELETMVQGLPEIFRKPWLVLKHKSPTSQAQLHLWQLQGYVAEYEEVGADDIDLELEEEDMKG